MTTVLDDNVYNIAIDGSFDDGQRIMKELFADLPFKASYNLSAINSVNWARVAAQVVYYFYAAFKVQRGNEVVDVCVPTGNFGNIMAGYLARAMGAPIGKLILATNENDILSRFFNTGEYSQGRVAKTLSPSMDIQVASNFERYLYYCVGEDSAQVCELMDAFKRNGKINFDSLDAANPGGVFVAGTGSNAATIETIREVFEAHDYVLDPHTAVGVHVAQRYRRDGVPCVCLATAHPAKFLDAVADATGRSDVGHHPSIDGLHDMPTRVEVLPADRDVIRGYIAEKLG